MLAETFSNTLNDFFKFFFIGFFFFFFAPGVNFKDVTMACLSVGVALPVRKELGRFVDRIHTEYDTVIILKLSRDFLGTASEVVLLGSYAPANSVYYKETEITNGISLIEQCIMDIIETVGDLSTRETQQQRLY